MPPTTILYHPKAWKPYFCTKRMKNLMASRATMNATTLPMMRVSRLFIISSEPPSLNNLYILYTVAPNMVGTAKKKENSAAFLRVIFCAIPPTMVAIERDTPGIMEMHWKRPIIKARFSVSTVSSLPLLKILSQNNMNTPPTTSMMATTSTRSSMASMKSLQSKPNTTAGMKAISSFQ